MRLERRVAVLGAGGFVGQNLVQALSDCDCEVFAGIRTARGLQQPGVHEQVSEYSRPEHFAALLEHAEILIHCASENTVASSSAHPLRELDSELKTSLALIEALQNRKDIHIIYISSGGTVYGQLSSDRPITEDATPFPKSYHGAAKLSVEYFLRTWAIQNSASLSILRPSNIYGPGQHYRPGFGVVPAMFRAVAEQRPFRIRGSLATVRDFLYINDFRDLILQILASAPPAVPLICNAGQGLGTTLGELIQAVERVCQTSLELQTEPALVSEVDKIVLDIQTASNRFGWCPQVDLDRGLTETWHWWQAVCSD